MTKISNCMHFSIDDIIYRILVRLPYYVIIGNLKPVLKFNIQMTCRLGFSHHTLSSYIPYPTMFLSTPWTSRLCLNINSFVPPYVHTYFSLLIFMCFYPLDLQFRNQSPQLRCQ